METLWIGLMAGGVFLLLVLLQVILHSKRPVRKALGGLAAGWGALLAVNLAGMLTGVFLPLSPLVLGTASVAGVPGVTMLLLLDFLMK